MADGLLHLGAMAVLTDVVFSNLDKASNQPQNIETGMKARGRNILLVDDVLTTGATAEAASRALNRVGAARVSVLALARVVKATELPI
jgi:predicted amidophosphoribosyltransferase